MSFDQAMKRKKNIHFSNLEFKSNLNLFSFVANNECHCHIGQSAKGTSTEVRRPEQPPEVVDSGLLVLYDPLYILLCFSKENVATEVRLTHEGGEEEGGWCWSAK